MGLGQAMSDEIVGATDVGWFDNRLRNWADKGLATDEIADYLNKNSVNATEAIMRVEYLISASEQLITRMNYEWLERLDISNGLFAEWTAALNNPMNFENIIERYEEWAKQNRRWELILNDSQRTWESVMLGAKRTLILARCDALDESSRPRINLLAPKMSDPSSFDEIDAILTEIEENEARQKRMLYSAVESLQSEGYDVEYIVEMNVVDAITEITRRQKLHNLHEMIRLQIIDEIAEYDELLAENFETQRKLLLNNDSEEAIMDLSKRVSSMGLDLKKRLSKVNLQIADWLEAGVVFPTSNIAAKDMFEWETNLPELTTEVEKHLAQVERYKYYSNRMNAGDAAVEYIGDLHQTQSLAEITDELELRWQEAELECYSMIEKYQNQGLVLDEWNDRIEADPVNSLALVKFASETWQMRLDCIDQLLQIDISFEGKNEIEQRINLLREIDVGDDVIQDTKMMIHRMVTRRARHRALLEKELMELIAIGKAAENTASNKFSLSEFEEFVSDARKHGQATDMSLSHNSITSGKIGERIADRIDNELEMFEAAGWYIDDMRAILQSDPIRIAKLLPDVRNQVNNHAALCKRLASMPWNRNISLALQIQEEMRDPLNLPKIAEQIPSMMKTIANRPIEDEGFTFTPWRPKHISKSLSRLPKTTIETNDALEDAHEAILETMSQEILSIDEEHISTKVEGQSATVKPVVSDTANDRGGKEAEEDDRIEDDYISEPTDERQYKIVVASEASDSTDLEHLHILMEKIGLGNSYDRTASNSEQIGEIRRSLAKNVGKEPRDIRVDRMLRLILRLLPQSNEYDGKRKVLIMKIASGLKRYENWVKMRLEARHKAAKGNLILDSATLGKALERIPGPGFRVPLEKDEQELPALNEIVALTTEVDKLLSTLNLTSASGVVVSA